MVSSHFDSDGAARMVDVSQKAITVRTATAQTVVRMQAATLQMIAEGSHKKGDVLAVARLAAIMATKQTQQLIPLCHAIPIEAVDVAFSDCLDTNSGEGLLDCRVTVRTTAKTGVEMEAMTAATIAGLTVYDMCKSVDRGMQLETVRLIEKSGGQSGDFRA
ncbi:cyclic pyranopterin monophosphate synthase MoaC [Roseimaritima ulvae]|uniref:Cyclic pyranopterin monophosphate synthase n=1 Tax=Roseimaritima ulvae TaxID=980254 RepID=A0A5B9QQ26_9BACT|nr:cyclic pyranopterin monophosphate synthase MoaC [Roseimaritima ulvae]QEG41197.1 Cyclic pyranopterin monophosphate synthase accessory protein [Roseimaritima ulvae]